MEIGEEKEKPLFKQIALDNHSHILEINIFVGCKMAKCPLVNNIWWGVSASYSIEINRSHQLWFDDLPPGTSDISPQVKDNQFI